MVFKSNNNQDDIELFCPKNRMEWRQWLELNHISKQSVWLVYFKKNSGNFIVMPNHTHGILIIDKSNYVVCVGRDVTLQRPYQRKRR